MERDAAHCKERREKKRVVFYTRRARVNSPPMVSWVIVLLFLSLSLAKTRTMDWNSIEWVHMGSNDRQGSALADGNHGVTWNHRVDEHTQHECTFHLKNPRQGEMEALLLNISDPRSPQYGHHLTREQLHEMTHNAEGERVLLKYLQSVGATVTNKRDNDITARAPIEVWERALHTEFFHVHSDATHQDVIRAHHFSLPKEVAEHMSTVMHVLDLPVPIHHGPVRQQRPRPVRDS